MKPQRPALLGMGMFMAGRVDGGCVVAALEPRFE
jgi:hypothetical protein